MTTQDPPTDFLFVRSQHDSLASLPGLYPLKVSTSRWLQPPILHDTQSFLLGSRVFLLASVPLAPPPSSTLNRYHPLHRYPDDPLHVYLPPASRLSGAIPRCWRMAE